MLSLKDNEINFSRFSKTSNELKVSHSSNLKGAHIQIGPKEKCPDTKETFYGLVMALPTNSTRIIYFKSKQMQKEWYQKLLSSQGFKSQID